MADQNLEARVKSNEDVLHRVKDMLDQIDADRAKAKAKEANEAWTKQAAISLVVIAVLSATAVQRSGSYSGRSAKHINASIYNQVSAGDQWGFFQSKSTKGHIYELGIDLVQGLGHGGGPEQDRLLAEMREKSKRYDLEKTPISEQAKKFERLRDDERAAADEDAQLGGKLGIAVMIFQASIAIASICLVMKKKPLWFVSLAFGTAATAWMFYVLFFFHLPPRPPTIGEKPAVTAPATAGAPTAQSP